MKSKEERKTRLKHIINEFSIHYCTYQRQVYDTHQYLLLTDPRVICIFKLNLTLARTNKMCPLGVGFTAFVFPHGTLFSFLVHYLNVYVKSLVKYPF